VAAIFTADLGKAEEYCARATRYRGEPDGLLTAVFGHCYGAMAAIWRGRAEEGLARVREADQWIDAWTAKHGAEGPLGSMTQGLMADVHLMRNELEPALFHVGRAIELAKKGMVIAYCEASRILCHIAEAQRDWATALAAARETFRTVRVSGYEEWVTSAAGLEYDVLWRRAQSTGDREDAGKVEQWCEQAGVLDVEHWRDRLHPGLMPDKSLLIGASVLLHQKRYAEAEQLSAGLFEEALRRERVPGQISALVLRSLAQAGSGKSDAAVDTMRQAIDIASGPRYMRFLLEEGSAVVPLIERAAPHVRDRDFALRVLSAFEVPVKLRPSPAVLAEPLSEREVEVLRLIASGASNQEAARKLFVAPSTVKKHLENIYAKLGVGGRTQAVARARELQILA
jgi:ATP/maltotriose-dependent transcriptional regulator MalT